MTHQTKTYAQLVDRLNEVAAKLEEPQKRKDFLALCDEYDQLMSKLEELNPEVKQ